jgi:hypothetical protein
MAAVFDELWQQYFMNYAAVQQYFMNYAAVLYESIMAAYFMNHGSRT